jgi:GT2 family glycosyltransferase
MAASFPVLKTVTTIIVTYNGLKWIDGCLKSVKDSIYPSHIHVIDNGSTDGTIAFIRDHYPEVQLTVSSRNLGFGQANNIGMKQALDEGADYVFLLNQDAFVEPETVGALINAHAADASLGIISPLHLNGKGNGMDANFLEYFLRSAVREWTEALLLDKDRPSMVRTDFVNAAAWLITADCLQRTGGFDPIFFHYGEDDNYAQRVRYWGLDIGVFTGARIRHDRESRSGAVTLPQQMKKEWVRILIWACNIRRQGYRAFVVRRTLRHAVRGVIAACMFNLPLLRYHFILACRTIGHMSAIGRCRRRSMQDGWWQRVFSPGQLPQPRLQTSEVPLPEA